MKKYFHLFFVALFATVSFVFVGCEETDELDGATKFNYNGTKLYHSYSLHDVSTPSLSYESATGVMQMNVFLFPKTDCKIGGEARVQCNVEVKPFNVNKTHKGDSLEIITSRYTWIEEYEPQMLDYTSSKKFFKVTEGGITFNGKTENGLVALKVNMTVTDEEGTSRKMAGTLKCVYKPQANYRDMYKYIYNDYPY